jgi:hypothetical protein
MRLLIPYHAFGVIGTALSKTISVFRSSSQKVVQISPNALYEAAPGSYKETAGSGSGIPCAGNRTGNNYLESRNDSNLAITKLELEVAWTRGGAAILD